MNIIKIERGLIDDDFIHNRETLKVYFEESFYYPFKLYKGGRIVNFSNYRNRTDGEYQYKETDIPEDIARAIRAKLISQLLE